MNFCYRIDLIINFWLSLLFLPVYNALLFQDLSWVISNVLCIFTFRNILVFNITRNTFDCLFQVMHNEISTWQGYRYALYSGNILKKRCWLRVTYMPEHMHWQPDLNLKFDHPYDTQIVRYFVEPYDLFLLSVIVRFNILHTLTLEHYSKDSYLMFSFITASTATKWNLCHVLCNVIFTFSYNVIVILYPLFGGTSQDLRLKYDDVI